MTFTPIDLQTWPRGQMFCYFSKMAPTGYSLTVNMDATALRKTLKEAGRKFFPAYLWLVTKNLNRWTEFKVAQQDGIVGYYDTNCAAISMAIETFHSFGCGSFILMNSIAFFQSFGLTSTVTLHNFLNIFQKTS